MQALRPGDEAREDEEAEGNVPAGPDDSLGGLQDPLARGAGHLGAGGRVANPESLDPVSGHGSTVAAVVASRYGPVGRR
jgi:hypothetical protein